MNWLKLKWGLFVLNLQYGRKLAEVQRDRFKNHKRGLQFEQRGQVHLWAHEQRKQLIKTYQGAT